MENEKICILIDSVGNSGGTDRVAVNLSNMLNERGKTVTIFTLDRKDSYYDLSKDVIVEKASDRNRWVNIYKISSKIKARKYKAVIVISMGRLSVEAIPLLKLFAVKCKIICSDHVALESFNFIKRLIKITAYRMADEIVVLTDNDKSFLINKYKISQVRTIRNPSSFPVKEGLRGKENIVLAIGRFEYQKNFQRLISIWKNIASNDWELVLVGSGSEEEDIRKMVSQQAVSKITILEPTKDLSYLYSKASIIAMTSRYEGLPMVLIEAKSFGLCSIAFDCKTGPKEIIDGDGYVISYYDDKEYEEKLKRLLKDNKLLKEFSDRALSNSMNYTPLSIVSEWEEVIK